MTRNEFAQHVLEGIEAAIQFAEQKSGRTLSRRFVYQKLFKLNSADPAMQQENVVEYLVDLLWQSEDAINPVLIWASWMFVKTARLFSLGVDLVIRPALGHKIGQAETGHSYFLSLDPGGNERVGYPHFADVQLRWNSRANAAQHVVERTAKKRGRSTANR